ncbi:hypothetical protein H5410_048821 [Solanum commersonii]|uniref:F-box domain-containing protein n=1 Tax=Solanum commersonii TaxID=4109 RepID=A0A9J5XJA4_SOLCO|nr:hypothetical protein H5410_048821 [Solanum commersonii]
MSNSNIPNELVFEILKRVPIKSLIRFKCVSKSFDSLNSEPLFIEAHRKSRVADFLVYYIILKEKFIIYNLGQDDLTCVSFPVKYLKDPCFRNLNHYSESINGVVCMWNNRGDVAICNPFTREHVFLPNPSMEKIITSSLTCCSLGFDPTIKKFIVLKVCLVIDNSLTYWIFTIGVDKSWRKASTRRRRVVRDEKIIRTIILSDEIIRGYSPKLIDVKGQVVALVNTSNFHINFYVKITIIYYLTL